MLASYPIGARPIAAGPAVQQAQPDPPPPHTAPNPVASLRKGRARGHKRR